VRGPQQAHLSGAMAGGVEHGQPAGDRQHLAIVQRVINRSWIDPCEAAENRPDEEPLDQPVDYARGDAQRPETAARRDDRRIGRMAVHGRPCRRPDSGQATDVVRVGVGDGLAIANGQKPTASGDRQFSSAPSAQENAYGLGIILVSIDSEQGATIFGLLC